MSGDQGHKRQIFKGTDINLRRLLKLQNQTQLQLHSTTVVKQADALHQPIQGIYHFDNS